MERQACKGSNLLPIAHGGNVHAVQIRVTVVAFSGFRDKFAPIPQVQRIAEIRLPDFAVLVRGFVGAPRSRVPRSEEHTSELQSRLHLVCRLLLEKKKTTSLSCSRTNRHSIPTI